MAGFVAENGFRTRVFNGLGPVLSNSAVALRLL